MGYMRDKDGIRLDSFSVAQPATENGPAVIFTAANGNQGLTSDGVNFYWGINNGNGVSGSILKLDATTGATIATFTGPPHAAGADWRQNRDTLLYSTGGTVDLAAVWEIDKNTGAKVRSWDFSTTDYTFGALVAWDDTAPNGDVIYLFTSNTNHDFKIRKVQIRDDGAWVDQGLVIDSPTIGIPQDLAFQKGSLYYLTDDVSSTATNLRRITRYAVQTGAITQDRVYAYPTAVESEGMAFHRGQLYFGDSAHSIYRAPWQPMHQMLLGRSLMVAGQGMTGLPSSAELVAMFTNANTAAVHTGVEIGNPNNKDAYLSLARGTSPKWHVRNGFTAGDVLHFRTQPDNITRLAVNRTGQVSINAAGAFTASAQLRVDSTTTGFLPPRMTTAQKTAIATPAEGLVVYDTDLHKLCVFTTKWETITSA